MRRGEGDEAEATETLRALIHRGVPVGHLQGCAS